MQDDDVTSVTSAEQPASPEIVMFFLGPDGEALEDGQPPAPRTIGEVYRSWRTTLVDDREHGELHRHRNVTRQVQGTGRPGKHGYRDEIVVTLRSRPIEAVAEALRGDLFEPPIRWLTVDQGSLTAGRYELDWTARIAIRPWHIRTARLRLYASPSLNVTVLSLFPRSPRAVARRRFLRRGLTVMNDLRDRVDERVAERTAAVEHGAGDRQQAHAGRAMFGR